MSKFLLNWWISWWDVGEHSAPRHPMPNLVVAISYGICPKKLTDATRIIAENSLRLASELGVPIVASSCCYLFNGAEEKEWQLKTKIWGDKALRAGDMNNSVEEGQMIAQFIRVKMLPCEHLVIVTGQSHTRFIRWLYGKLFPTSKLTVISAVDYEDEYQPDHPAVMQRTAFSWFRATLQRHVAFAILGMKIANLHHRSTG